MTVTLEKEKHITFWQDKLKKRAQPQDLELDGKAVLKSHKNLICM
jgi:hypothetical protein